MFPDRSENPYIALLRAALEAEGAAFVEGHGGFLGRRWLISHAGKGVVLYIHWLSVHYTPRRVPSLRAALKFLVKTALAKVAGYRVVWTCHNIMPHELGPRPWIHSVVRHVYGRMADVIIVHSRVSRSLIQRRFHCGGGSVVAPHGDFIGVYGDKLGRAESRRLLGIPHDAFVYCFIGRLRRYKGVERLIRTFKAIAAAHDRLIIAGLAEPGYGEELRELAEGHRAIDLQSGWLPDQRILQLLSAADVMVFPFTEILNSSSVILAMSYSALSIVPRMGSLPEILPEDAAVYFEASDPTGLRKALLRARSLNGSQVRQMGERAHHAATALSWQLAAKRILEAVGRSHA